jgi:hypothetical protein
MCHNEVELVNFWTATKLLNSVRHGVSPLSGPAYADSIAELEGIASNTAWDRLRRSVCATLDATTEPAVVFARIKP